MNAVPLQLARDDPAVLEKCSEIIWTVMSQLYMLASEIFPPTSTLDFLVIGAALVMYVVLK